MQTYTDAQLDSWMRRCFELAIKGIGHVSPNPLVGCVVVHEGRIIAEGFHRKYGEAHAEPDAIRSLADQDLLKKSTLFVNLEPCAHHGKTPPCVDLIIEKKIPKVCISNVDPHDKVAGKGIKRLKEAGVEVIAGILEKEGRELNRRFFTFMEQQRPYIILKWAQTADGFIDKPRIEQEQGSFPISGKKASILNHKWRSEEDAILVGTQTALNDNPELTVRHLSGRNPVRVLIDKNLQITKDAKIYNQEARTLVFNQLESKTFFNHTLIQLDWKAGIIKQMNDFMHHEKLGSLIVEGGAATLNSYLTSNCWDELRVIISPVQLLSGLNAPNLPYLPYTTKMLGRDEIRVYRNT